MADIIQFPQESGRRTPVLGPIGADATASGLSGLLRAEVVIFPGVRVERDLPEGAVTQTKGDGKPKRGRG